jgi:hypothetical protein
MVNLAEEMRKAPSILNGDSGIEFLSVNEEIMPDHIIAALVRAAIADDKVVVIPGHANGASMDTGVQTLEYLFGGGQILEIYRK